MSGTTTLTVAAATLTSIAVTPANPNIAKGLTEPFTAIGTYTDGSTQNLTATVTWTSSSTTVATISATGLASTLSTGSTTITAQDGSVSGATTLTVTPAVVTSIAVTPTNPTVVEGTTQQFIATGTYTDGSTANLTSSVTWSSSNLAVATIDASGVATGLGTGSSTITAISGSVSGATTLKVTDATVTGASVSWGPVATVALQTAADGLRLLPAGRKTDLPWFGINRIGITLSNPATLVGGNVTVTSAVGIKYGPVTISGSGTNYVITLAQPINTADRVTFTIASSTIATYTRRLDVLPGDVNDDGSVNTTDGLLILDNETPAHSYQLIYDLNGDGSVNMADFTLYRPKIGTVLPAVPVAGSLIAMSADLVDTVLGTLDQDDSPEPPASVTVTGTIAARSPAQKRSKSPGKTDE